MEVTPSLRWNVVLNLTWYLQGSDPGASHFLDVSCQ